jgi:phenylacetate-CoA ligase
MIEVKRGCDESNAGVDVASVIKRTFEVAPRIEILPLGTLAAEFERSVKAPRFVDRRT